MTTKKWFDRKFDFNLANENFDLVKARLKTLPGRLQELIGHLPEDMLTYKPEGKWSIKEQAGHLWVLESLWQARIEDFRQNKPSLTPADLDNKDTTEGAFNDRELSVLLKRLAVERSQTLQMLDNLTEEDKTKTSLHPRLKQPMRVIDHLYFVAEHDDHHIERIDEIIQYFVKK